MYTLLEEVFIGSALSTAQVGVKKCRSCNRNASRRARSLVTILIGGHFKRFPEGADDLFLFLSNRPNFHLAYLTPSLHVTGEMRTTSRRELIGGLGMVVLLDRLLCSASLESEETAALEDIGKTLSPLILRGDSVDANAAKDAPVSLEDALDGWEVSPQLLEELITPTEEKVNLLIDSSIASWTDSHAENVPEEVRKEMVGDLERARQLGLRQVRLFNYMVKLKGLIDASEDGDGVYLKDLMKWCRHMFLNMHAAESELFAKQEEVRKQFFQPGETTPFSLESRSIYLLLRHRADAIVRRFEGYMAEPKEGTGNEERSADAHTQAE